MSRFMTRKTPIVVPAAVGVLAVCLGFGSVGSSVIAGTGGVQPAGATSAADDTSGAMRERLLDALLADKAEEIVRLAGATTDRERTLAIAEWIASNISNRAQFHDGPPITLIERAGLCGERAELAVAMLNVLHVPARVLNIYNLGGPGGGHSAIQAHIDGDWAYFDVMYAGYFERDGEILSWAEVIAEPEAAVESMVVFPNTLDRWGGFDTPTEDRAPIDNHKRMRAVYTPEHLRIWGEGGGFARSLDVKTLRAEVNLAHGPISLGSLDRSATDVQNQGVRAKISERLGVSLNTFFDSFRTRWVFTGLTPGEAYEIRYDIAGCRGSDLALSAAAKDATISAGHTLIGEPPCGPMTWTIRFVPTDETAQVLVEHGFDAMGEGFVLDRLQIGEADED